MTARPYVLHLHTLSEVAGSGLNTFLTMKHLAGEFPSGLAAQPGGRLEEKVRAAGFDFFPLPSLVQPVSPGRDFAALFALRRLLDRLRPAILHTHNSKAGFVGRLAARTLPASRRPKVVHTVHGFAFHDAETPLRRALFRYLERRAFPWADAVIAISPSLARWGSSVGIGRETDYHVIPSGIDLDEFRPRPREAIERVRREVFGLEPEVLPVGLVSKLWEGKGHEVLLLAARRLMEREDLPPFALVFVGEGPLEKRLRARAAALGLTERVRFLGFREDVAELTAAFAVATLPSFFEGMGRVVLEAMASGVPVVASRVGGVADVATAGALLVPPGSEEALAAALGELLADPSLRAALGEAGRTAVAAEGSRYRAEAMARAIGEVYREVLTPARGRRGCRMRR